MEIKGKIVVKPLYVGTKSEHKGVCLHTSEDSYIKLRRPGGNPFNDDVLNGYIGKEVTIKGDFFKPVMDTSLSISIFMCNEIKEI